MNLSTLAAPARFESIVKRSKFIAQAAAIDDAGQASIFLDAVRESDATHNCWAYRIGEVYRSSDDGEPAGTAGRPILAAIDGQQFDRVVLVVARWFGGIKLGAGGLVRAYGGAASECLRNATRTPLVDRARLIVVCGFEHVGAMHQLIMQFGADKHAEHFTEDGLHFDIELPSDRLAPLQIALRDATRGQARIMETTG
ncbi:MAG TPA: YigZ family protein [Xanthomonadaceae bacterium]|jgi:uncharacterized YigZ family protein|nr:YigZ family protein [Xanthomonadaceae bacterium]